MKRAWAEARALMWQHRRSLSIGLVLMLVSRVASISASGRASGVADAIRKRSALSRLRLSSHVAA